MGKIIKLKQRPTVPFRQICLRSIFNESPLAEIIVDINCNIVTMNKAMQALSGHSEAYHQGKKLYLCPDDYIDLADALTRFVLEKGGTLNGRQLPLLKMDGSVEEVLWFTSPILMPEYGIKKIVGLKGAAFPISNINLPIDSQKNPHDVVKEVLWEARRNKGLFRRVLTILNITALFDANAKIIHDMWTTIKKAEKHNDEK